MKRKIIVRTIISLVLFSAVCLYFYYSLYQVYKINKSIDVSGIKLLMPLEEVIGKMSGEGKYIYGMGGFGYEYESEKIGIFF
ncbi:MAG TPA: hypothetical protein GXX37_14145 [Clostridiaceae bacterium]|nr:hypothetical protein [Clostridiaceae bacterium]